MYFSECRQSHFAAFLNTCFCRKIAARPEIRQKHGIAVLIHDTLVAGPFTHASLLVAKNLVAEQALVTLGNPTSEMALARLCNCGNFKDIHLQKGKGALQDKTNADPVPVLTTTPDT